MIIEPLASRVRPTKIEEVIGQQHLLNKNKPIYQMIKNNSLSSMIFFGPPGIGKTTIANAISNSLNIPFRKLNGVSDGKKEIVAIIDEAEKTEQTICLYIDEIHRLTKTQSEPLLPVIENGNIILIGSTTESVYHSLPSGILSRCTIYELKPLTKEDIFIGLKRVFSDKEKGLGEFSVSINDEQLMNIASSTGGDMRSALNVLENVVITNSNKDDSEIAEITKEMIEFSTSKKQLGFDGKNDSYNFYSAFQKSIRGSDPDASIYYLGLLLESDDLKMVCRRLSIIAFEDISLADPSVWSATMAAVQCAEQVGMPEARIPLANATILLALSPKSNSAYSAMNEALGDIRSGRVYGIPAHLADAHYAGAAKLGRGVGYQYPHDYQTGIFGGWVQQEYLPKELKGKQYYRGIPAGKEKTYIDKNNIIKNLKNKKDT